MFSNFVCKIPASSSWTPGPKYHLKMEKKHQERIPYIEISPSFGIAKRCQPGPSPRNLKYTLELCKKNTEKSPSKRKGSFSNHCFQFLTWLDFRGAWIYIWFIYMWMYIYKDYIIQYICIPRTHLTSTFEGQPPQNKAFSNQNRGHLGSRYIDIYIYTCVYLYT